MAAKFARGPALALAAAKAAIDGGLDTDLGNGLKLESHLFASLFATADREIGMRSFLEQRPGQGGLHRYRERGLTDRRGFGFGDRPATPNPHASAAEVEAAWADPKLANILYHDWEAGTYDEKWSISFDERCVEYARDRFVHAVGPGTERRGRTAARSNSGAAPASSR